MPQLLTRELRFREDYVVKAARFRIQRDSHQSSPAKGLVLRISCGRGDRHRVPLFTQTVAHIESAHTARIEVGASHAFSGVGAR